MVWCLVQGVRYAMRPLNFRVIIFLFSIVSVCVDASEVQYKIGDEKFSIPSSYVANLSPWGWLKSISGLDEGVSSVLVEFPESKMKSNISGYIEGDSGIENTVSVEVTYYDELARKRFLDTSVFSDIWSAKKSNSNREVLYDDVSKLYFVFEKSGYRGLFTVFSVEPIGNLPVDREDFYVASCSSSSVSEIKHAGCNRRLLFRPNIMINIGFSFSNLRYIKEIEAYILNNLNVWQSS